MGYTKDTFLLIQALFCFNFFLRNFGFNYILITHFLNISCTTSFEGAGTRYFWNEQYTIWIYFKTISGISEPSQNMPRAVYSIFILIIVLLFQPRPSLILQWFTVSSGSLQHYKGHLTMHTTLLQSSKLSDELRGYHRSF